MPRNPNKPRIPKIWDKYSVSGVPLKDTRIISFKTPITSKNMTPEALVKHLKNSNHNLGLVIDLTDTDKYYDSNDFVALNVVYLKLPCKGMKLPLQETVDYFNMIVERFILEHSRDKKLIGVHCFGGVNRTGYMVCRYLIDKLKWKPSMAIHMFQEARGHTIDAEFYRTDLLKRAPSEATPPPENEKKCSVM